MNVQVTDMVADIKVNQTRAIEVADRWGVPYKGLLITSLVVFGLGEDGGASVVEFQMGNGSELTTVYGQALSYAESLDEPSVLAFVVG